MRRVLIPNRGEIAARIVRACFDEQIECVVAASAADVDTLAARLADRVIVIGPPVATESYLSVARVVQAALNADCDALHPGYGFLSERPSLVDACEENGITFVGPPAEVMRRSGDKLMARAAAEAIAIPTGRGSAGLVDVDDAIKAAAEIGAYPLLLKASAGGGGRGMTIVRDPSELAGGFARSSAEAEKAFGDGTVYLEPYIEHARHIEVQLLADRHGNVVHLGERDCSVQRRYQKIIEEAPSTGLPPTLVDRIRSAAVDLAKSLDYEGAATCEFLVDVASDRFVFLEINARVQVEHPVTEMVTGIDIVREQLRIARGEPLSFRQEDVVISGHAIECRINAEDAERGFLPTPGTVREWWVPAGDGLRVDTYMYPGAQVSPYYDSLVAKMIAHGRDRTTAIDLMRRALAKTTVSGISTTADFQAEVLAHPEFHAEPVTTTWLETSFLPARATTGGSPAATTTED